MSTADLKQSLTAPAAAKPADPATRAIALLEKMKPQIARALPSTVTPERMARVITTQIRLNPTLALCTQDSFLASILILAQLGLEPGVNGQAWLVPYYSTKLKAHICQPIPGWMGINDLVTRTGRAGTWTGAVYQGDHFDYMMGDDPFIDHKPEAIEDDPAKLTHVYAVGRIAGVPWPIIDVWTIEKVKAHLKKYNKVGDRHYGLSNLEMYGRKVALLQVVKYLPKTVEMQRAMELEGRANEGVEVTLDDVLTTATTDASLNQGNGGGVTLNAAVDMDPVEEQPSPEEERVLELFGILQLDAKQRSEFTKKFKKDLTGLIVALEAEVKSRETADPEAGERAAIEGEPGESLWK